MTTYSLSTARKKLSELVTAASQQGEQFHITVNGKTAAMLLSEEDYESLMETLEILQNQKILHDISASEKELANNEAISVDQL